MSQRWFYNTTDTIFKPIEELVEVYKIATAQNNYLLLNCPPNRDGVIREKDIQILTALRENLSEI
jgi:alpha-L-fucosidase